MLGNITLGHLRILVPLIAVLPAKLINIEQLFDPILRKHLSNTASSFNPCLLSFLKVL